MRTPTSSRIALVALTAAIGFGGLALNTATHADSYGTGTCGAGITEHVITHVSTTTATLNTGAKLLVPTTAGMSGATCTIDGESFTVVGVTTPTGGTFEVWKGGTSATPMKVYRIKN